MHNAFDMHGRRADSRYIVLQGCSCGCKLNKPVHVWIELEKWKRYTGVDIQVLGVQVCDACNLLGFMHLTFYVYVMHVTC